jgi:hypothetical protein
LQKKKKVISFVQTIKFAGRIFTMAQPRTEKEDNNNCKDQRFLLGYTYYLDRKKSAYVTTGYNCNTFKTSILFVKKNSSVLFNTENWDDLCDHIEFINKCAFDSYSKDATKFHDRSGAVIARITKRKEEKVVEISMDSTNKVAFNLIEWTELTELSAFLRQVIKWNDIFNNEIENYYKQYLKKCKANDVTKLTSNEFFLPHPLTYNYCNFSRLFHEIPILCRHKLILDLYD